MRNFSVILFPFSFCSWFLPCALLLAVPYSITKCKNSLLNMEIILYYTPLDRLASTSACK